MELEESGGDNREEESAEREAENESPVDPEPAPQKKTNLKKVGLVLHNHQNEYLNIILTLILCIELNQTHADLVKLKRLQCGLCTNMAAIF